MKNKLTYVVLLLALASTTSCKNAEETCIDQSKIDPDRVCTMEYKPVCGCDGKTYGNACEAERAGVTSYEEGACAGESTEVPSNN